MSEQEQPKVDLYFTSNRFLAKAIAFSGLQFSVYREYDREYLDSHKCATIRDAESRKLPGRECWMFEKTGDLNAIIEEFDCENAIINQLVEEGEALPFCESSESTIRCREFVRAMRGAQLIDRALFSATPFIRVWDNGRRSPTTRKTDNGTVVSMPGSRIVSSKASDEIRKHMGL